MASQGCTQLSAINYDPNTQTWDYSCMYIFKVYDTVAEEYKCIWFNDAHDMKDCSFTLSFSQEAKNWVFFHDYIPDYYYHTRGQVFSTKDQTFFEHNTGDYGTYYDTEGDKSPFFIDVVFKTDSDFILETVNWMSSVSTPVSDQSSKDSEWPTLTHISIWNSQQHTGRIALSDVFEDLQYETSRKTMGNWSMNDFRNVLTSRGTQFINDLFDNYSLDSAQVSEKSWYEKELIEDKYCIVRFEFDNSNGKQLILHDTSIQGQKSNR